MASPRRGGLTVRMFDRLLSKARRVARAGCVLSLLIATGASAQAAGLPEAPAVLPVLAAVPPTQAMPLDGTWIIDTIQKKIRIEAGRAYAVDSWLHLFVLRVQPGMVVIRNITPTAAGRYAGEDLPLVGPWTATVQADRTIQVSVAGALGPVGYSLTPVHLDNPTWYASEMAAAGLAPQYATQPGYSPGYQPAPPPGYQVPPAPVSPITQPPSYPVQPTPDLSDDRAPKPRVPQSGEIVNAVLVGPAKKWGCKGRDVYFTPHNGGECWACPDGFRRTTTPIWKSNSCNKRGLSRQTASAKYVRSAYGCEGGQFHRGKSCYVCPPKTKKISVVGVNPLASCVVD